MMPVTAGFPEAPAGRDHGLRVAVVSDATPERNGVGSYYADLVRQLAGRVARAELFCPCSKDGGWHRRLTPPLPGDGTQRLWFPRPLKLWRQVSSFGPHAIVVPTPGPWGLVGLLAARKLRVPLIVGFHTHYEALAGIYWADTFGRACRWYLESCNRLLFRHSTVVLANSPDMADLAVRMGARTTALMGTSLAAEFLERPPAPLTDPPRRVLFAGRLACEKNLPEVIALAHARPDLEVGIAGDGPLRHEVAAAASALPNLTWLGWIPRDRLIATIDAHDILLLPSKVESFGTVALEGMARGRIVIVSGACGIVDWPDLREGLYRIAADESVPQAVERVCALPAGARAARAAQARRAARDLNEWNLASWMERLAAGREVRDPGA